MNVDIVLQGPIYPYTPQIIDHYLALPFINKVIVSCWTSDSLLTRDRVEVIKSHQKYIKKPGCGNVNYQIQTSRAGIAASSANIVFKIRTDQQFHPEDMEKLVEYLISKGATPLVKLDGSRSLGKIVISTMYSEFPYHARDHIYLGYREDMLNLFTIPFSDQDFLLPDTVIGIRPESYIGAHYCGLFDSRAKQHSLHPSVYLTDKAVYRQEAMGVFEQVWRDIFITSPLLRLIWKKQGVMSYSTLCSSPLFKEHWADNW